MAITGYWSYLGHIFIPTSGNESYLTTLYLHYLLSTIYSVLSLVITCYYSACAALVTAQLSLSHYQHCCLCLHCPRIILKTFVPDISMSQLQYLQKEDVDLVLSLLDFRLRFISPNSPLFEERFVFSGGDGLMVTGVMLVIMS